LIGVFQIDENVAREIINHRSLRHPNIIRFKEVCTVLYSVHMIYMILIVVLWLRPRVSAMFLGCLICDFSFAGGSDSNPSGYCYGVCGWWRAL